MSQPAPVHAGSPGPCDPPSPLLPASRGLITSRVALPVRGVSAAPRYCTGPDPGRVAGELGFAGFAVSCRPPGPGLGAIMPSGWGLRPWLTWHPPRLGGPEGPMSGGGGVATGLVVDGTGFE